MNNEEFLDMYAIIEAMLFAAGAPLECRKMAEAVEMEYDGFMKVLSSFELMLDREKRGVKLVKMNDCAQLVTKSEYHSYVSKALETRSAKTLSQSALEVLSIVAYNQPVTKVVIDSIRGVDSYNSLCRLMERELIEERGHLNTIGHPKLYGTTNEFLRMFGLQSIHELPPISENVIENVVANNDNLTFEDVETADFE